MRLNLRCQPALQPSRVLQAWWATRRTCGRQQCSLPRPTHQQQVRFHWPTTASLPLLAASASSQQLSTESAVAVNASAAEWGFCKLRSCTGRGMTADCCTALVLTAAVYVANIVEDEQPDWTPPEDPEADVETEDESHAAGMLHGICICMSHACASDSRHTTQTCMGICQLHFATTPEALCKTTAAVHYMGHQHRHWHVTRCHLHIGFQWAHIKGLQSQLCAT